VSCTAVCCAEVFRILQIIQFWLLNPLNAEWNPICHLLALLGGATIVVVSRLRVNVYHYTNICTISYTTLILLKLLRHYSGEKRNRKSCPAHHTHTYTHTHTHLTLNYICGHIICAQNFESCLIQYFLGEGQPVLLIAVYQSNSPVQPCQLNMSSLQTFYFTNDSSYPLSVDQTKKLLYFAPVWKLRSATDCLNWLSDSLTHCIYWGNTWM
jgi:hypothetical protein